MELSGYSHPRQSLLDAIHRFNTATTIMDETIMVPSMLQDMIPEKEELGGHSRSTDIIEQNNLYDSYLLLKSLRHDMKWGINQDSMAIQEQCSGKEVVTDETGDLVDQFQHHLRGLLSVLAKLTKKANLLTSCYKKEIEHNSSSNKCYSRSISY